VTVSIIKLSSGETVMAEVLSYDEETYDLEVLNPLQLSMVEDLETHKMQMFSSSWIPLFGEKTTVEIRFIHIIAVSEATDDMIEYYYGSLQEMRIIENTGEVAEDYSDTVKGKIIQEIIRVANTSIH